MSVLSNGTLMMAVQAVAAEIRRFKESVHGEIGDLEPEEQEVLMAYSQAAMELKKSYLEQRSRSPDLPPYETLTDLAGRSGSRPR